MQVGAHMGSKLSRGGNWQVSKSRRGRQEKLGGLAL